MGRKRKAAGSLSPNPRRSPRLRGGGKQAVRLPAQKGTPAAKKLKFDQVGEAKPKEDEVEARSPRLRAVASKKEKSAGGKAAFHGSPSLRRRDGSAKKLEKAKGNTKRREEEVPMGSKKAKAVKRQAGGVSMERTIIVEACTQCKSFKQRAEKVKTDLESSIPGIVVQINPQKPRLGYFEIREERTEVILSLPGMKRPFTEMKQLDMDKVVNDLIKRCR